MNSLSGGGDGGSPQLNLSDIPGLVMVPQSPDSTNDDDNGSGKTDETLTPPSTSVSSGLVEEEKRSDSARSIMEETSFQKLKERGLRTTVVNRTPKDFFFIKMIGEGSFSTVYFAKEVDTGDEYAIKVLLKKEIRREGKVRYVLREKDIMAALTYAYDGHPFVVKLYCTFQDPERLYFAITYAKHGELLDWLRRLGSFDENVTLFYASEILLALEFLHKCKVIHRDMKPENILVGTDWHIMLSDFGTAKIIGAEMEEVEVVSPTDGPEKKKKNKARSSFVGTAQYISPEVLKSENVGPECDYWALGAIIFQMISGQPPFRALNEYQILKKILGMDYQFPDGFPAVAKDLVEKLLVDCPERRLGSAQTGGIEALKIHDYFKGVDWLSLPKRTPPELKPYLPASSGEPAFYSDYQLPENLEPGLNEAALTRLMGLTSGSFCDFEYSKEDSMQGGRHSSSEKLDSEITQMILDDKKRNEKLEAQRNEHKYHRFVDENLILKSGLIDKKKGLFARRRMFLLTEGPRLFYVDPVNMDLKGEVPFSQEMRTEAKNFRTFFVHTPKRTYYLFDPDRHAKDWCDAIDTVRERYFKPVDGSSIQVPENPPMPQEISSSNAPNAKPVLTFKGSSKSLTKSAPKATTSSTKEGSKKQ